MLKIELRPCLVSHIYNDRDGIEAQSLFRWLPKARVPSDATYKLTYTQNSKAINIKLENIEIANKVCNVIERVSFVPSTGAVQTD